MQKDTIAEIKNIVKVETDFHDLGIYGEYYGLIIHFNDGRTFTIRMEEHQFNNLALKVVADKPLIELA